MLVVTSERTKTEEEKKLEIYKKFYQDIITYFQSTYFIDTTSISQTENAITFFAIMGEKINIINNTDGTIVIKISYALGDNEEHTVDVKGMDYENPNLKPADPTICKRIAKENNFNVTLITRYANGVPASPSWLAMLKDTGLTVIRKGSFYYLQELDDLIKEYEKATITIEA